MNLLLCEFMMFECMFVIFSVCNQYISVPFLKILSGLLVMRFKMCFRDFWWKELLAALNRTSNSMFTVLAISCISCVLFFCSSFKFLIKFLEFRKQIMDINIVQKFEEAYLILWRIFSEINISIFISILVLFSLIYYEFSFFISYSSFWMKIFIFHTYTIKILQMSLIHVAWHALGIPQKNY